MRVRPPNRFAELSQCLVVAALDRALDDPSPMFDLRIKAEVRNRGYGGATVAWLTRHVFTEQTSTHRIEATTRQDNWAMRRVLRRCGYVKEAHYREAWEATGGLTYDAVGYAILRRDWASGTVTLPD
jgi:RimJ/RimL family protein N-acetyltransferase